MSIDWSKAPEGATHYYTRGSTPWRDLSGENWKWFSNGKWYSDNAVHSSVDRSSQGFLERRCAELIPRPIDAAKSAADERLQHIRNACSAINSKIERYNVSIDCSAAMRATVEAMIDAGYRKFEIVEEDV